MYSTPKDDRDRLICTVPSDHLEGKDYVDRTFIRMGVDPAAEKNAEITELAQRLSSTFATYKRAFYNWAEKDDMFHKKYNEYQDILSEHTGDLMREIMKHLDEDSTALSTLYKED